MMPLVWWQQSCPAQPPLVSSSTAPDVTVVLSLMLNMFNVTYTDINTHTDSIHTQWYISTHTRTHMHTHARTCTHTHTHTQARTRTHTYTSTHAHTHKHARTHTHTSTRARTHTHTHTHRGQGEITQTLLTST